MTFCFNTCNIVYTLEKQRHWVAYGPIRLQVFTVPNSQFSVKKVFKKNTNICSENKISSSNEMENALASLHCNPRSIPVIDIGCMWKSMVVAYLDNWVLSGYSGFLLYQWPRENTKRFLMNFLTIFNINVHLHILNVMCALLVC